MLDGIVSVEKFPTGVPQLVKARASCRVKSLKVRQKMKSHISETNEQLSPAAQRCSPHLSPAFTLIPLQDNAIQLINFSDFLTQG